MLFFGANINENIDDLANGGRVRFFTRDVATVDDGLDDVENDRVPRLAVPTTSSSAT